MPLLVACLALTLSLLGIQAEDAAEPQPRPNILVLVLDDLGLEMLRIYEEQNLYPRGTAERVPLAYPQTPAIDRLAREGVRFTQARVPPTCSTTRATLLSGRYAFRHGIGGIIRRADSSEEYAASRTVEFGVGEGNREWTIAHLARAAGYRSFMAGKWHLALLEKQTALGGEPGAGWEHIRTVAGFDDYWAVWGNLPGWPTPDPWTDPAGVTHRPGYSNFVACANGEVQNLRGEYLTSVQVDRVLEFVDQCGAEPWLVYSPFNAAHAPFQLPPDDLVATPQLLTRGRAEREAALAGEQRGRSSWPFYLALVEALDREIGRLIDGLGERGQLEQTLILLIADNGTPETVMSHAVRRERMDLGEHVPVFVRPGHERFKHTVWEPGVRVPWIVRGPGVVEPGRTSDVLVDATDLFETLRDLLGVTREDLGMPAEQRLDGVSMLPVLRAPEAAATHARNYSLVEHFEPNGNPELVAYKAGGMRRDYLLRRALILRTDAGTFKLVRNLDAAEEPRDLLFQLYDAAGAPVDPWERAPLRPGRDPQARALLVQLQGRLDALLQSEPRNWR